MTSQIQWPGWEIGQVIGRGSFGRVYSIRRELPGNRSESAALKVISIPRTESEVEELRSSYYSQDQITHMFWEQKEDILREYATLAQMRGCANIVYCDDFRAIQHTDGVGWDIYIKMELLTPLMKYLEDNLTDKVIRKMAMDICNALTFCEKNGILHRDIKPANIFVAPDGSFKLGDFGIAKTLDTSHSEKGTRVGTPPYMAPEVSMGEVYDHRADIYSLGLVLYELLNEFRRPFEPLTGKFVPASTRSMCLNRRLSGETLPPPAHGDSKLVKILLKACAFDPAQRYASAAEMLRDLQAMDSAPIPSRQNTNPTEVIIGGFCPACGAPFANGATFCGRCGKPVRPGARQIPQQPPVHQPPPRNPEPPKKQSGKLWILIPVGLGVVAILALILFGSGILDSMTHTHDWARATCTDAQTCRDCGETQGSPRGHDWQDSTCQAPRTCSECGETKGSPRDHDWAAATAEEPKTCRSCGITEGNSLGFPIARLQPAHHSDEGAASTDDVAIGTWQDVSGNTHPESIKFWVMNYAEMANTEHIAYRTEGSYTILSGTVSLGTGSDYGAYGQVMIYGDGRLLYQSPNVSNACPLVEFRVDITGVRELRIEGTTQFSRNAYILLDAIIQK